MVELIEAAKEELYIALQALENGDLPWARSSSQRASHLIIDAHQNRAKSVPVDPIK